MPRYTGVPLGTQCFTAYLVPDGTSGRGCIYVSTNILFLTEQIVLSKNVFNCPLSIVQLPKTPCPFHQKPLTFLLKPQGLFVAFHALVYLSELSISLKSAPGLKATFGFRIIEELNLAAVSAPALPIIT